MLLTRVYRQASVERWRMVGQHYENSAEASWVGKHEEDGDFSHAPGASAERALDLRDSAAVKIRRGITVAETNRSCLCFL
jgi:hypothetical protein